MMHHRKLLGTVFLTLKRASLTTLVLAYTPYLINMLSNPYRQLQPYEIPLRLHARHFAPETGRRIVIHTWTAGARPRGPHLLPSVTVADSPSCTSMHCPLRDNTSVRHTYSARSRLA